MAKNSHGGSQGDIDNVISNSSSVGIAGSVTCDDSERILGCVCGDGVGRVQAEQFLKRSSLDVLELIEACNSLEEEIHEILSGEVAGSQVGNRGSGSEDAVDGISEEDVQDGGEGGVKDVVVESLVVVGIFLVPSILGNQTGEEFVDKRVGHSGLLAVIVALEARAFSRIGVVVCGGRSPTLQ